MEKTSDEAVPHPDDPADPDPTVLLTQVQSLIHSLKGFVFLTASWRRKINSAATLPDEFYRRGASALDHSEWLTATSKLSSDEIRSALKFSEGVRLLAGELELLAKGLRGTAAARTASVGQRLLLAYSVARRHNRGLDTDDAIPHIKEMEAILRARRRRGRGKAQKAEPEEPVPPAE